MKGASGEGGSSGGEVRVYDRRVDLGKELELVGRVGVMLRYGRVGSVSVGDMSRCGCYTQRGVYGD